MKRVSHGIAALGIVLLIGLPALAQSPAGSGEPTRPMTNLQVWPKDASPAQVLQTMNAFNESLGVECNYCHGDGDFQPALQVDGRGSARDRLRHRHRPPPR